MVAAQAALKPSEVCTRDGGCLSVMVECLEPPMARGGTRHVDSAIGDAEGAATVETHVMLDKMSIQMQVREAAAGAMVVADLHKSKVDEELAKDSPEVDHHKDEDEDRHSIRVNESS